MLYTFAKTFHEQTLSFAVKDPSEKPVERRSPTPKLVEDFNHRSPRFRRARRTGSARICRRLHFQARLREAQSRGRRCSISGRDSFAGNPFSETQRNPVAACGSE